MVMVMGDCEGGEMVTMVMVMVMVMVRMVRL